MIPRYECCACTHGHKQKIFFCQNQTFIVFKLWNASIFLTIAKIHLVWMRDLTLGGKGLVLNKMPTATDIMLAHRWFDVLLATIRGIYIFF